MRFHNHQMQRELLTRGSSNGWQATPSQKGRFWWAAVSWTYHWQIIWRSKLGASSDIQVAPAWKQNDTRAAVACRTPCLKGNLLSKLLCIIAPCIDRDMLSNVCTQWLHKSLSWGSLNWSSLHDCIYWTLQCGLVGGLFLQNGNIESAEWEYVLYSQIS